METPHLNITLLNSFTCGYYQIMKKYPKSPTCVHVLTFLEDIQDTQRVHSLMLLSLLKQCDGPVAEVIPEGAVFPLHILRNIGP